MVTQKIQAPMRVFTLGSSIWKTIIFVSLERDFLCCAAHWRLEFNQPSTAILWNF